MNETAKQQLEQWDRGESVWSIEMGGLGPGYEQAIQILAIKARRPDPKQDPAYRAWIRLNPCVICQQWGFAIKGYSGSVECAHVGKRGLGQKCPDRETLPLCVWHHRTGPQAVHVLGREFWNYWKLNRYELIAAYNRSFERKEEAA